MTEQTKKKLHPLFIIFTLLMFATACGIWLYYLNIGGVNRFVTVDTAVSLTNGDPEVGYYVISSYGCGSCHEIPGVYGASGKVGPSLSSFKDRVMIAGVLA